jgi:hypothetical protein
MENITNEATIVRGSRLAKIATFSGLGLLLVGLVVSLMLKQGAFIWVSFGCLILGFLISSVGTLNMNRWVREPRADQALAQGLKGFDDRYRLYNYVLPAPHVLLSPLGLFVLTAMNQDGVVRYEGDRFHRNFSLGRMLRFMADEGLGRPFAEADRQVQALRQYLDGHNAGEDVEIHSIMVFYNPRAELSVTDPPRPIVDPKGMKKAIRKQKDGNGLSSSQLRRLQELFEARLSR